MRLAKLRKALAQSEDNLDAVLVYQPQNRRYISGFTGSEAMLLITQERAVIATDSRYWEQSQKESPAFSLYQVKTKYADEMEDILAAAGHPRHVGFESAFITVDQLDQLTDAAPEVEWVAAKSLIEDLRQVKDDGEIALIREAARVTDEAFAFLCRTLRPGLTEREAAWELEVYMRTHGADKLAFDLIVGLAIHEGPRAGKTAEAPLPEGSTLTIEPGIYLPGWGGVRIEDLTLVGKNGVELLSQASKEPIIL